LDIMDSIMRRARRVDERLMTYLDNRGPERLAKAVRHYPEAGGKRLRPVLAMVVADAVSGQGERSLPFGCCLELIHNFTLVHDDVMDHDDFRRGHPTVHKVYGVPMAILAGDLLFAKVYDIVAKHAPRNMRPADIVRCFDKITEATLTLCQGQALDMVFSDAKDVSEDEYIAMVSAKTSALFKACAEVGAIAGGAPEDQIEALGKFAWDAGIAFQIVDDILGLTADEDKLGKPVGSDVREGKKTLIVIHALTYAKKRQKETLLRTLGIEDADDDSITKAVEALSASGSIQYAKDVAKKYMDSAYVMLDKLPDSAAKNDLRILVDYFVNREY